MRETYNPRHIERLNKENKLMDSSTKIIQVNTKRIETICYEHNIKNINYLSIDVEGVEFEVIKSINFDNNYHDYSIPIVEYLKEKDY